MSRAPVGLVRAQTLPITLCPYGRRSPLAVPGQKGNRGRGTPGGARGSQTSYVQWVGVGCTVLSLVLALKTTRPFLADVTPLPPCRPFAAIHSSLL